MLFPGKHGLSRSQSRSKKRIYIHHSDLVQKSDLDPKVPDPDVDPHFIIWIFISSNTIFSTEHSRHLYDPAHVVRVDSVLDGPLGQLVPLIRAAAVDGQAQLGVLGGAVL